MGKASVDHVERDRHPSFHHWLVGWLVVYQRARWHVGFHAQRKSEWKIGRVLCWKRRQNGRQKKSLMSQKEKQQSKWNQWIEIGRWMQLVFKTMGRIKFAVDQSDRSTDYQINWTLERLSRRRRRRRKRRIVHKPIPILSALVLSYSQLPTPYSSPCPFFFLLPTYPFIVFVVAFSLIDLLLLFLFSTG